MDFQFWLYIVIGVIWFLSRILKKPEQQTPPTDLPDFNPAKPVRKFDEGNARPAPQKALTFEELLREITEQKATQQPKYEPQAEAVNFEEVLKEEEEDLEDVEYDYGKRDKVNEVYEEAKRQAFARPSLEETLKLEDTPVHYGKFKGFQQEQQRDLVGTYLADFRDREGLKKAVVMSEILQRKF